MKVEQFLNLPHLLKTTRNHPKNKAMAKEETKNFVQKSTDKQPVGPGILKTEKFGRTISKPFTPTKNVKGK